MAEVTGRHPRTTYTGLQKSLQKEWDYMQCVTPEMGLAFQCGHILDPREIGNQFVSQTGRDFSP